MNGRVAMKYQPNVLDLSKINGECTGFCLPFPLKKCIWKSQFLMYMEVKSLDML